MSIEFNKNLITGNSMIDEQHRELISRVNRLTDEVAVGAEMRAAIGVLDYLMDYVEFHFTAEEDLQEKSGYPGLADHRQLHKQFVSTVRDLQEMLRDEEGPSKAFVAAVKSNVEDWLVNHIQIRDKEVADYVRQQEEK